MQPPNEGLFIYSIYSPKVVLLTPPKPLLEANVNYIKVRIKVIDLFGLQLTKTRALCILGLLPDNNTLTSRQRLWIRLATTTGCRIILGHWKSSTLCCFREWTEQMTRMATYERVTYRVMGREDIFNQVWGSFLMAIEGLSV